MHCLQTYASQVMLHTAPDSSSLKMMSSVSALCVEYVSIAGSPGDWGYNTSKGHNQRLSLRTCSQGSDQGQGSGTSIPLEEGTNLFSAVFTQVATKLSRVFLGRDLCQ